MSAFSLSSAWDETRSVLDRDGRLFASVALALLVLPQAALGAFAPTRPEEVSSIFYWLLMVALIGGLIGQLAIARLAMPPSSTVGDAIAVAARRFLPLFAAFIIVVFAVMILAFVLAFIGIAIGIIAPPTAGGAPTLSLAVIIVIPFVLAQAVFQLMIPVAANETGGVLRLISRSWKMAIGNYWRLLAFLILAIVGMLLIWGSTQLAIGSVIAAIFGPPQVGSASTFLAALAVAVVQAAWAVVTVVMLARIYVQLSGRETVEASS